MTAPARERFQTWAEPLLTEADVSGAAVGVWRHGTPLYAAGLGFRDREAGLTPNAGGTGGRSGERDRDRQKPTGRAAGQRKGPGREA